MNERSRTRTQTTLGDLISTLHGEFLALGYDEETASVATAITVQDLLGRSRLDPANVPLDGGPAKTDGPAKTVDMDTDGKRLTLRAILSVTTGILLAPTFGDVHEVFNVLYPGIMQIGMLKAAGRASQRLIEQHPGLAGITCPNFPGEGEAWLAAAEPWLAEQERRFGTHLWVTHDSLRDGPSDLHAAVA